jgi:hypothetical protein
MRGTPIEKVPKFNYLGAEISDKRELKQVVTSQAMKAARISGRLYKAIWRNKHMSTDWKVRIYKTSVRPVLTCASETRAETAYTQTAPPNNRDQNYKGNTREDA